MRATSGVRIIHCLCALLLVVSLLFVWAGSLSAAPEDIVRCSTKAGGGEANSNSYSSSISADGRYVAFESNASDLVSGDTNSMYDIFRKDLQTGAIVHCSTKADGGQADNNSQNPSISADGRYVAFQSYATDLVPGDTNAGCDIFRKDLQTGAIVRCSTKSGGAEADNESMHPSITADGRYVAFTSSASNLVTGDDNGVYDIFRKDLQTGAIVRCSIKSGGGEANNSSGTPSISSDGRYVAFYSGATDLVPGDTNGGYDIFRKDLQTGAIMRCSTKSGGGQANGESEYPSMSSDGRYVSFYSTATDLVSGDTNGVSDVFRKDIQTGAIIRCSIDSEGEEADDASELSSISADGRYVAFESCATDLVPDDGNGAWDIFRKDLTTGAIVRCSSDSEGEEGNENSSAPSLNVDARYVTFASIASNLVSDDTAGHEDVFRKELVVTVPTTFYFAEGYTGVGFDEWLCLGNPGGAPVEVTVTYMFKGGGTQTETSEVPALSRSTISVNGEVGPDKEVSIKCEASSPFVAERPMYFDYHGALKGGHTTVGH